MLYISIYHDIIYLQSTIGCDAITNHTIVLVPVCFFLYPIDPYIPSILAFYVTFVLVIMNMLKPID